MRALVATWRAASRLMMPQRWGRAFVATRRAASRLMMPWRWRRAFVATRRAASRLRPLVPIGERHEGQKTTRHAASLRPSRNGRIGCKPPYSKRGYWCCAAINGTARFAMVPFQHSCRVKKKEGKPPLLKSVNRQLLLNHPKRQYSTLGVGKVQQVYASRESAHRQQQLLASIMGLAS